ncbi:hypothetical protein COR50_04890 [Chitinophaga caeni]|uniref:Peptidase S54 rhomboid domain-containing protein n=1 Tax=Chitinophaga caeni TaxID=2029983 RepID=A0A291QRE6_9BACT|nr:rhomboid family intramembrane serine protease [Chitinophaga caeni]ATL46568.1 hypothetical protein COR50_04890 [Chitinophaga caeni]
MPINLSPKVYTRFRLDPSARQLFLAACLEAAKHLQWDVTYLSANSFIARDRGDITGEIHEVIFHIIGESGEIISRTITNNNSKADREENSQVIRAISQEFNHVWNSHNTPGGQTHLVAQWQEAIAHYKSIGKDKTARNNDFFKNILGIFIPGKGYEVTPVIIGLNVLVYILMVITGTNPIDPSVADVVKWGANNRELVMSGQWWRLITSAFLHGGIIHLLFNMYAFVYIGVMLEPILGRLRFIIAYVLAALLASIASIWYHDVSSVGVGASGAIFGMYGVFLALLTTNFIDKHVRKGLLSSIGLFVVFNLAIGAGGNIDNSAHIGGLIGGLICGYIFYLSLKKPDNKSLFANTNFLACLVILAVCWFLLRSIH